MNQMAKRKPLLCASIAVLFMVLSLLMVEGIANAEAVKCKDYFTLCVDGGCDASPGWIAQDCVIRCGPVGSDVVTCLTPMN